MMATLGDHSLGSPTAVYIVRRTTCRGATARAGLRWRKMPKERLQARLLESSDRPPRRNRTSESRFAADVETLAPASGHADRMAPLKACCSGAALPGERKSVEPMAARVESRRRPPVRIITRVSRPSSMRERWERLDAYLLLRGRTRQCARAGEGARKGRPDSQPARPFRVGDPGRALAICRSAPQAAPCSSICSASFMSAPASSSRPISASANDRAPRSSHASLPYPRDWK